MSVPEKTRAALRPFLAEDTPELAAIFRAAIAELTAEDYDDDQREAWAEAADDEDTFGQRLASLLTLVAVEGGEPVGFIALKDDTLIDLLYVHPDVAGTGVGTLLCRAAEAIAQGRGIAKITVDASDTAYGFFLKRGYVAQHRNTVTRGDAFLGNTTMTKALEAAPQKTH